MPSALGKAMHCPGCGRPVSPTARVCPHCGKAFVPQGQGGVNEPPLLTGSGSGDTALGIGIAFVCAIIAGWISSLANAGLQMHWYIYGSTVLTVLVGIYIGLRVRYPVVGKAFGIAVLMLFIVIPTVVILGALAICAAIMGAFGNR